MVCAVVVFLELKGGTLEKPNDDGTSSSALPVGLTHSCASSWLFVCSHGKQVLQSTSTYRLPGRKYEFEFGIWATGPHLNAAALALSGLAFGLSGLSTVSS